MQCSLLHRLRTNLQMAESMKKRKVCVIGAGAAGLCAARHFARSLNFELNVFEQTNDIGGTWVYKEATVVDENGLPVHSSMYRDLRFNFVHLFLIYLINFSTYFTLCYVYRVTVKNRSRILDLSL